MAIRSRFDEICVNAFCKLSLKAIFAIVPRITKPITPQRNLKYIVADNEIREVKRNYSV